MSDTLQAISRSLSNDVRTLSSISHNVANINTPGYRGVRAVPQFDPAAGLREVMITRNGGLAQTARPFDLALQGRGYFAVEREGQVLLARGGAMRINADGFLVTVAGDRVLGTDGPIALRDGALRFDASGDLWIEGQRVAQLLIVDAADPSALQPAGGGAYTYAGQITPGSAVVVQGALERANVEPAEEMLRLMETMRHAESVQRAMSIYDRAMDAGVNKLGDN